MLNGVVVSPLKFIKNEKGSIMHMLKVSDRVFEKFGEIYFSTINSGIVKGWHKHSKATMNYAVPHGCIKFALYDERPHSSSYGKIQECTIGVENNYALLTVPPGIRYSWRSETSYPSLLVNCSSMEHDPHEADTVEVNSSAVPYIWSDHAE